MLKNDTKRKLHFAIEMHAGGYILKPIKEADIKREIQELRYQIS